MACYLWRFLPQITAKLGPNLVNSFRHGHHLRGKPPGIARSLKQRLEELNRQDQSLSFRVDIGLPPRQFTKKKQMQERIKILKANRNNPEMEKMTREKKLMLDLDEVNTEWLDTSAHFFIKEIADHYGIYQDLFGDAYFYPMVPLSVAYSQDDVKNPVYFGNVIKPADTTSQPEIAYKSDENTFWTLILTNPDGQFTEQEKEYVHWFIGNIPGNQIEKGETIVEYLQPFPPKGTGYHRLVFVLYKQEEKIDFSQHLKSGPCLTLNDRTFKTLDFYRAKQDDLTPAGLAFFQTDWDSSLTDFYHNTLNMREPIFEYDFPPPYIRKQEWFPKKKPFNLYMDKYRDPKQINKEFLMRKLKNVHPFKAPEPPLPYPNAFKFEGYVPSWLKLEIRKTKLKWGRINDIE